MWNYRHGIPAFATAEDFVPFVWIFQHPEELFSGWSFSVTLLGILLAHEFGHWLLCARHRIVASWPYLLPAPTLSGTAGAVIRIRFGIPSLDALMDVGISGPVFGFVVAMPAALLGLLLSKTAVGPAQPVLIRLQAPLAMQPAVRANALDDAFVSAYRGPPLASRTDCCLGGAFYHFTESDSGWATGRRPHSLRDLAALASAVHDRCPGGAAGRGAYFVGRMDLVGNHSADPGDAALLCAFGTALAEMAADLRLAGAVDACADFPAGSVCGCGVVGVSAVGDGFEIVVCDFQTFDAKNSERLESVHLSRFLKTYVASDPTTSAR